MPKIRLMTLDDVNQVCLIENECFDIPWTKQSFVDELKKNKMSIYVVAEIDGKVVGYGGMWHIINEGHITNIAVSKEYRKQGIGKAIVQNLIDIANKKEMVGLTLEVRVSNTVAINLYTNLGFIKEGVRKEYYSDNREDALIMWKYLIDEDLIV